MESAPEPREGNPDDSGTVEERRQEKIVKIQQKEREIRECMEKCEQLKRELKALEKTCPEGGECNADNKQYFRGNNYDFAEATCSKCGQTRKLGEGGSRKKRKTKRKTKTKRKNKSKTKKMRKKSNRRKKARKYK